MKLLDLGRFTIAFCAAEAILVACATGSQTPFGPATSVQNATQLGTSPQSPEYVFSLTTASHFMPSLHPGHRSSWMSPDAKHTDLLYVNDDTSGEVNVYNYKTPNGKGLLGRLTGFEIPSGDCSDAAGNVYITDFEADDVVEYEKSSISPIKTLKIAGNPDGCSVDPATGNLAVSSFDNVYHKTHCGGIWVFPDAKVPPTLYRAENLCRFFSPGYDNKSNLYVEGWNQKFATGMGVLPKGARRFTPLKLSGFKIGFPGSVMWDGGTAVAATDQQYKGGKITAIYRVTVSSSTATLVSTTKLTDSCGSGKEADVAQPWIMGMKLVGGNTYCRYRFGYWNNMHGGDPGKTLNTDIAPRNTGGETVSR